MMKFQEQLSDRGVKLTGQFFNVVTGIRHGISELLFAHREQTARVLLRDVVNPMLMQKLAP